MDRYAFLSLSLTHELHRIVPLHRCDLLAGKRGGRERDEDRETYFIVWPLSQFLAALSLSLSGFRGSRGMDLIRFETKE